MLSILPARPIISCAELMAYVQDVGFLPLLDSGIAGFSAEALVDADCRYVTFPDGGWDWPLWKWKGPALADRNIVYGKFFAGKAGFVSRAWWTDLCHYRRSVSAPIAEGSIEETILLTLRERGSLITRDLRRACGFAGPKMRSRFDAYVTRLQMACRIVTEDFVYPRDRHGNEYGWGWALLTTPEQLLGHEACDAPYSPEVSRQRLYDHLRQLLPDASEQQLRHLIG